MFSGAGDTAAAATATKPADTGFNWSGLWANAGNIGSGFLTWQQAEEKRKLIAEQTRATEAQTRALQAGGQGRGFMSSRSVGGIPWNLILIAGGLSLVGLVFLNKKNKRRK